MKPLNREQFPRQRYPGKIMQFGEGNFLRAFIDWQIDHLNKKNNLNAGVSVIRPIDYDSLPLLDTQDGLYTTIVRGIDEHDNAVEQVRIIDCVNEEIPVYKEFDRYMALAESTDLKVIFSNTTEAGIEFIDTDKLSDTPAKAFPAKLTQWLYKRFQHFKAKPEAGLIIIPCELIDYNGEKLKDIVLQYCELWDLEPAFRHWLETANHFCSTLVDRIVTGFPKDEHQVLQEKLGYLDNFMVTSEYFHLFVIQGPDELKNVLKLDGSELNIKVVDDIYPYKQRKVAILNGAHTALVPLAYMSGIDSVGEAMADPLFSDYVQRLMFHEIIPTLDLPQEELAGFAHDVIKRFKNPYIHHLLLAISLNSMTKFRTRLLPQLLKYSQQNQQPPVLICAAIAGQILMYRGIREGDTIPLSDAQEWLLIFEKLWQEYNGNHISLAELVSQVLGVQKHWAQDLNQIAGLHASVTEILTGFMNNGVRSTLAALVGGNEQ